MPSEPVDHFHDHFTLSVHRDHRHALVWAVFTKFIEFSTRNVRWEIRRASADYGPVAARIWNRLGQDYWIAGSEKELNSAISFGGNLLIEPNVANTCLPGLLRPHECVKDSATSRLGSFIPTDSVPDQEVDRRAPTRKLRMRVLKRDGFRCVICGRRSVDHEDIELHVHHVLPWRYFGPTAEWNLATLCGTCHKGLDPDYEPELRELAGLPATTVPAYASVASPRNLFDITSLTDNFLFLSGEIDVFSQ